MPIFICRVEVEAVARAVAQLHTAQTYQFPDQRTSVQTTSSSNAEAIAAGGTHRRRCLDNPVGLFNIFF